MNKHIKHVFLPAIAPVLIVALYFTPVAVFGCRNRGLIAVSIALISAVAAFVSIGMAFSTRIKHDPISKWWILSAAILTLPLALLVGPLG